MSAMLPCGRAFPSVLTTFSPIDSIRLHFSSPIPQMILWSDESKIKVSGSNHCQWSGECPSVKHSGDSVVIWSCISGSGVGHLVKIDLIMKSTVRLWFTMQWHWKKIWWDNSDLKHTTNTWNYICVYYFTCDQSINQLYRNYNSLLWFGVRAGVIID